MFESTFADFVRQIPPVALVMFCISGTALVFAVTAAVIERRRKFKRLEALALANSALQAVAGGASDVDPDLLPGLDDLTAPAARAGGGGMFSVRLAGEDVLIDVVEIVTFARAVSDGSLIVQAGDKAYRLADASADPELGRRLNTVREALGVTAGSAPARPPAQPATPPPVARPASIPITPPASPTSTVIPGQLPGDLPRFKMPDKIEPPGRFRRPKRPDEVVPEINIAGAIEEYLQFKLSETQAFPGRYIHIRGGAKGGLAIDVDDRSFEAVDDIDDPDVRAFLKQTIQEWQERQG
ncbi:MAG: hypothetical protein NZM00_03175 [Anaerolinea sp.]|nr:hypothetical protein [Anaerolinea sp.]